MIQRKRRKGFTVVEVLVALTILGIVMIPITMGILNTQKTDKGNLEQIKINAITRIIKENVVSAVKKETNVSGNTDILHDSSGTYYESTTTYMKIVDDTTVTGDTSYDSYAYDCKFAEKNSDGSPKMTSAGTMKWIISIYKKNTKGTYDQIRTFKVETNDVPEIT